MTFDPNKNGVNNNFKIGLDNLESQFKKVDPKLNIKDVPKIITDVPKKQKLKLIKS